MTCLKLFRWHKTEK